MTITLLFTGWSSLHHKHIPCPSQGLILEVSSTGLLVSRPQQNTYRARGLPQQNTQPLQELPCHRMDSLALETPQVTQSSDSGQHHTMSSTSEGPGPRGQVNATHKVKADTMHQWSAHESSGLQCPYLVLVGLVPPATDDTHTPSSVSTDLTPPPLTLSTRGSHV